MALNVKWLPFLMLTLSMHRAVAEEIQCPQEIAQSMLSVSHPPAGWQPYVGAPLYLHAAGPAAAAPDRRAMLVEASSTYRRGASSWQEKFKLEGTYPEGKWLECYYGAQNAVTLSKRIGDETRECTVSYRKGRRLEENDIRIVCS